MSRERRRPSTVLSLLATLLAVAALGSLYYLPQYELSRERILARDTMALQHAAQLVEIHEYIQAEEILNQFVSERSGSERILDARFLLGRSIVERIEGGDNADPVVLGRAWESLMQSHAGEFNVPRTESVLLAAARLMRDRGLREEAAERFKELSGLTHDTALQRQILLDLSHLYSSQIRRRPQELESLTQQAMALIDEYTARSEGEEAVEGLLEKSRLYWQQGEFEKMRELLDSALRRFPKSRAVPQLKLQRGKAFSRLDLEEEAFRDLRQASVQCTDPADRDLARLHVIRMLCRSHDPECERLAGPVVRMERKTRAAARLLLGSHYLQTYRARPYGILLNGFREVDPDFLIDERIETASLLRLLRERANAPLEEGDVGELSEIFGELDRLYPGTAEHLESQAALWIASGARRLKELEQAPPGGAGAAERAVLKATEDYERAAHLYRDLAQRSTDDPTRKGDALKRAAQAWFDAGLFIKAAHQFREYASLDPQQNADGIFLEGVSYVQAGILKGAGDADRDALSVFSEYLSLRPSGSPTVARALLERGRIHLRFGDIDEAVGDFDRLMNAPGMGAGPSSQEWSEALRLKGLAELRRAYRLAEGATEASVGSAFGAALRSAQTVLQEYITRFGADEARHAAVLTCLFHLARSYSAERNWAEAERLYENVVQEGALLSGRVDAETEDALRLSHFMLGEIRLLMGKAQSAYDAFRNAYGRYYSRPEGLLGLVGQARAALELKRDEEARLLTERAQALYERDPSLYDAAMEGIGSDIWKRFLAGLAEKIGKTP